MEGRNTLDTGTLVVSSTAVGMADVTWDSTGNTTAWATLKPKVHHALISVETDSLRYKTSGTDPTNAAGHIMFANDIIEWLEPVLNYISLLEALRMIRVTTDATIFVTVYD